MLRRSFLAAAAAGCLPVAALKPKRKRNRGKAPPRARGVVVYVHTSERLNTWRQVPRTGAIIGAEQPLLSLELARRLAKAFNRRPAVERRGEWAIVVVTDGRLGAA